MLGYHSINKVRFPEGVMKSDLYFYVFKVSLFLSPSLSLFLSLSLSHTHTHTHTHAHTEIHTEL